MNHLTYKTEYVEFEEAAQIKKYLGFFFYIDGKKIESEEYNPTNCFDILDEEAKKENIVVLAHCGCGIWQCSSLVARIKYPNSNIVEWTVDELRYENNPKKYIFDKEEYDRIIALLTNEAELAALNDKNLDDNQLILKMRPDAAALLFNDNPKDADYNDVYGDDESVSIKDKDGNMTDISLNIPDLSSWVNQYVYEVLAPCESGEKSIEKLNSIFAWKSFHKQGLQLAIEIRKLLPENVFLKYSAPFEDRSGLIKNDIIIKNDKQYIEQVLNKII